MKSDDNFNRKSLTTGRTGFSIPFTIWPDRAYVPPVAVENNVQ